MIGFEGGGWVWEERVEFVALRKTHVGALRPVFLVPRVRLVGP